MSTSSVRSEFVSELGQFETSVNKIGTHVMTIADYIEHAIEFEHMALEASDPALKESFSKQALAYRKLAIRRAERQTLDIEASSRMCLCGGARTLVRVTAIPNADHDSRVYACGTCGALHTALVELQHQTESAGK